MKKLLTMMMIVVMGASFALAQNEKSEVLSEQEQLLVLKSRVEKQEVKKDIPNAIASYSESFAVGCKAFLSTFDEGAEISIERLNQFMCTPAGKMTVFFVGWKILGNDFVCLSRKFVAGLVGWALLIPYCLFVKKIYQSFIGGKMVLVKKEGKVKTYAREEPMANKMTSDSYTGWSIVSVIGLIAFGVILLCLIC